MLAQLINFGIVVLVLWFFALKPLSKKMQERARMIEKGLADAKESAERLAEAEKERKEIIQEARRQAQKILVEMDQNANQERGQILAKAEIEAERLSEEGKKQIETEKKQTIQQIKKEVADLVALATQKVLSGEVTEKIDAEVIQKALQEAERELKK